MYGELPMEEKDSEDKRLWKLKTLNLIEKSRKEGEDILHNSLSECARNVGATFKLTFKSIFEKLDILKLHVILKQNVTSAV